MNIDEDGAKEFREKLKRVLLEKNSWDDVNGTLLTTLTNGDVDNNVESRFRDSKAALQFFEKRVI